MAIIKSFITGDDSSSQIYENIWWAQTFTTGSSVSLTSIKLLLSRTGSPGTVTIAIKAVDGVGKPTGADLSTGTMDGDTLTVDPTTAWQTIDITPLTLSAATQYAFIVKALSGDAGSNHIWWRTNSSGGFSGGQALFSVNAGVDWTTPGDDGMFEVRGDYIYPTDAMTRVTGLVHRYSPGNYTLEIFLGDTQTNWEQMKPLLETKPVKTLPLIDKFGPPEMPTGPQVRPLPLPSERPTISTQHLEQFPLPTPTARPTISTEVWGAEATKLLTEIQRLNFGSSQLPDASDALQQRVSDLRKQLNDLYKKMYPNR